MKLTVKILQGQECQVETDDTHTVNWLKEQVSCELGVQPDQQRLLHRGKTLQDGTGLKEYNLKDGDKIHLVVKKELTPTQGETTRLSRVEEELFKVMRKSFRSDGDTRKVVAEFVKIFEKKMLSLSLDDIEKICERWNRDNKLTF